MLVDISSSCRPLRCRPTATSGGSPGSHAATHGTVRAAPAELEIAAGSMVYARRDEPVVVVPSKCAFKWSLLRSARGSRRRASGDVSVILRLATARAAEIVSGARSCLPFTLRGEAYRRHLERHMGPQRCALCRDTTSAFLIYVRRLQ
jgi:hypothetical protein